MRSIRYLFVGVALLLAARPAAATGLSVRCEVPGAPVAVVVRVGVDGLGPRIDAGLALRPLGRWGLARARRDVGRTADAIVRSVRMLDRAGGTVSVRTAESGGFDEWLARWSWDGRS